MTRKHVPFGLCLYLLLASCSALPKPTGTSLHAWDEDPGRMQALEGRGTVMRGRNAVLWFPDGALSGREASAVLARLDRGIGAAKAFIGKPNWRFRGDPRVYFYLPDDKFVSHAPGGNTAFLPLWRIRDDQAPWLHEALHLLLDAEGGDWLARPEEEANRRTPLWLVEGLAESLAMDVAAQEGLAHYSPLIEVPAAGLDALCAERLRTAPSERVLDSIGARGKLPELFGPDRFAYAVPFYTCSTSFVRYLAARYGRDPLLHAIAAFDAEQEELEREIGMPLAQAKADWLRAIGGGPGPLALPSEGGVPVAFVLGRDAEVLDFTGPLEVFAGAWTEGGKPAFKPYFVAADLEPVMVGGNLRIVPDYTFATAPAPKVIVIPAMADAPEAMIDWIRRASEHTDVTLSVCNGAFVLARTGLLDGKPATAHHGGYFRFAGMFPKVELRRGARFVEAGNVATAGGISSGIDLALRVVERYVGRTRTLALVERMEYQGKGWLDLQSNAAYAKLSKPDAEHPVCPLCGMEADPAIRSELHGQTYSFCSQSEKQFFDEHPDVMDRFLAEDAAAPAPR